MNTPMNIEWFGIGKQQQTGRCLESFRDTALILTREWCIVLGTATATVQ